MSIALMSSAWKTSLTSTQKLVLLSLCDNANDNGECFPSISMLMQKCSLSDRAIQKAMTELATLGFLRRDIRSGRATIYHISYPRTTFTPNDVHPERGSPTPERRSPPPPNDVHPTPERGSPITIIEPSIEPSLNHQDAFALPDWLPMPAWSMWCDYRKSLGKGWTPAAKRLAVKAIAKARDMGQDPVEVIENAIQRNWRGIFPISDQGQRKTSAADKRSRFIAELTGQSEIIDVYETKPISLVR